jgi:hypothetical protein
VGQKLIGKEDHRCAQFFRGIHGKNREIKTILGGRGSENGDDLVSMPSPAGLKEVTLGGFGGLTGSRTDPHHVHHQKGRFRHHRDPQPFLHEGETWAACGRHGFRVRPRCANEHENGSDLVFRLKKNATPLGKLSCHVFHDLRGGGDGVSRVKIHARGQRALS